MDRVPCDGRLAAVARSQERASPYTLYPSPGSPSTRLRVLSLFTGALAVSSDAMSRKAHGDDHQAALVTQFAGALQRGRSPPYRDYDARA